VLVAEASQPLSPLNRAEKRLFLFRDGIVELASLLVILLLLLLLLLLLPPPLLLLLVVVAEGVAMVAVVAVVAVAAQAGCVMCDPLPRPRPSM
jgi:hypothetical protein